MIRIGASLRLAPESAADLVERGFRVLGFERFIQKNLDSRGLCAAGAYFTINREYQAESIPADPSTAMMNADPKTTLSKEDLLKRHRKRQIAVVAVGNLAAVICLVGAAMGSYPVAYCGIGLFAICLISVFYQGLIAPKR
ncbi:MAG: hypothetical protein COA78_32555 [Blastopirellula sp.]|nr:MAG: hypothetical protein COA78_32555 [Blastopirellula sp.]